MIGNSIAGFLGTGVAASTNSYESIATATGTGASGVITFSSIPSTYSSLQIRWNAKTTGTGTGATGINVTCNGVTTSSYSYHDLTGNGTAASASGAATQTAMYFDHAACLNGSTSIPATGIMDILDYASSSKNKTFRSVQGVDLNGSGYIHLSSGLFQSTTAISSITITAAAANFATTAQFALYGIKG
jgi:hypothetical protein